MFHFFWIMTGMSAAFLFFLFTQPDDRDYRRLYAQSRFFNHVAAVVMIGWMMYGFIYETTYFLVP